MFKPSSASRICFGVGALAAALILTACSTSPMSRIDSNRAVYESWPVDVQEAVYRGQAIPGMTPQQVEMAMGKPTSIDSRAAKDGPEDIWTYKKSSTRLPAILENASIGVGTSVGGIGVGSSMPIGRGRSRAPSDADDQEIVFKNGVVLRGS